MFKLHKLLIIGLLQRSLESWFVDYHDLVVSFVKYDSPVLKIKWIILAKFVSPFMEYLGGNQNIHFSVIEVTDSGLTRKSGKFSYREKVEKGQRQGALMSGMTPQEIVILDKTKVRIFRYKEKKFKEEKALPLNFSDHANLNFENFKFAKEKPILNQ